jgi:hypothetical protein
MRAQRLALVVLVATGALLAPAASARECATMRLRAAHRSGELTGAQLAMQERPASVGSIASATWPARVHWADAAFEPRAEETLALVEAALSSLVDDQGWPAPLPDDGEGGDDRLDVYLGFAGASAAVTVAHEDVDDSDGKHASYAYVLLDGAMSAAELPTFVHHEVAHTVQFGVDLRATAMFAEASAVAHEHFALGAQSRWSEHLDDFQASPQAPIFTDGVAWRPFLGDESFYEFGAAFFLLYLEHEHGDGDGALLRSMWQAGVQPDDVEDNEPDWLDVVADQVGDPAELLLDFATWRALVAVWAIAGDGWPRADELSGESLVRTKQLLPEVLDGLPIQLGNGERPHQLGCLMLETRALSEPLPIVVDAESLGDTPRTLGIAWLVGDPTAGNARRGVHGATSDELTLRLTVPPRETAIISVCDVDEADADDAPMGTDVEVRVRRADLDPPVEDAGVPDEDAGAPAVDAGPPPVVCGCQSVPSRGGKGSVGPFAELRPYALVAGTVVGILIFGLRFARVRRRRKLYREGERRRVEPGA